VRIVLVGQPNSGKSTLFNAVVGYRSLTSNLAGTTVEYTRGQARVEGEIIDLVDLPGTYSLIPASPAEAEAQQFLLKGDWDVLIHVVDASQLGRSLELTLELMDLQAPLVICLNMMDEAARKGISIDVGALAEALDVPVVPSVASRGTGLVHLFRAARSLYRKGKHGRAKPYPYATEFEPAVQRLAVALEPSPSVPAGLVTRGQAVSEGRLKPVAASAPQLEARRSVPIPQQDEPFPPYRFRALQLLQSSPMHEVHLQPSQAAALRAAQAEIGERSGATPDVVISSARHAACLDLFESVAHVSRPRPDWREQLDRLLMHPVLGYFLLVAIFLGLFQLIFGVGKIGEERILALFDRLITSLGQHMAMHGVTFAAVKGAVLGLAGAVAVVLPYLLPFLIGLAILEDVGYLARVGYLMDAAMHRLGLHGTATVPVLLGYGCSVPAVMATRVLSTRRDRFVAAFLATLVPCSARMTVIFALVGFYLGANYALAIYILNLAVIIMAGNILTRIWPEISPGMLMEVPPYRIPSPRTVLMKTWWRLREFVVLAMPLLIAGSAVLGLVDFLGWDRVINVALAPLTGLMGLPAVVGLTLVFGVMRKELSLLMLMQALGTSDVLSVMSAAQILIFTIFVTFYMPCLATLASLARELGWRLTAAAAGALLLLAIVISLAARSVLHFLL